MKSHNLITSILFSFLLSGHTYAQKWPSTKINQENLALQYQVETVKVSYDPVYQSDKKYRAFPLQPIIKKLAKQYPADLEQAVIVFTAKDGYKVSMAYPEALQEQGYLAFKDLSAKDADWIPFKFGKEKLTPDPFYLVWPKPDSDEWRYPWPFQLANISMQPANIYFGKAAPNSTAKDITEGFSLFSRYCIRCHAVNSSGGSVGPELNTPQSVTELYNDKTLKALILNTPAYRPKTKMPVFNELLNENQVDSIVAYLKSMKQHKIITDETR